MLLFLAACTDSPPGQEDDDGAEEPACGNGIVDGADECEGRDGCAPDELCTESCTCEPFPLPPASSQDLIEQALEDGAIDYHTSLMYRVWALFQAPELPEEYDGTGSVGEDTSLFFEIAGERASLPSEIEAAVAPYLVRPTDPASIYSQIGGRAAPAPVGCPMNAAGLADWRSHESADDNFVIWSCGGGVIGTDLYDAERVAAGAIFEQAWDAMIDSGELPAPRPDQFPGPAMLDDRIDVYLLEPNQCRFRNGRCATVEGDALAAARIDLPCDTTRGGVATSSGYLMVDVAQVPESAPGLGTPSTFRSTAAHELFHLISYGLNLEAQGKSCAGGRATSWLTEASAEWATHSYFPDDDPDTRTAWFWQFQTARIDTMFGLQATHDSYAYDAFLYPYFVTREEEQRSRQVILDLWNGSRAVRSPAAFDDRLNALYPFVDHFRDFTVRNFNRRLRGTGIGSPHKAYDRALPFDKEPYLSTIVLPERTFDVLPVALPHSLLIAPLAMQTEHFFLTPEARWFRFDATGIGAADHLSLDVLVKVGDRWSRRRLDAPVFAICRENPPDDVSEMYVILSNHGHRSGDAIADRAEIQTSAHCPGGWGGEIRVVTTVEEHVNYSDAAGSTVSDRVEIDTQTWTVVGTRQVRPDGYPEGFELETIDTHWRGTFSVDSTHRFVREGCGETVTTEHGAGSGSGQTSFTASPFGDGRYGLTVVENPESYEVEIGGEHSACDGGSSSNVIAETVVENAGLPLAVPEIAQLTPVSSEEPGVFSGSTVYLHDVQPTEGGESLVDITVSWSLRRTESDE